MRPVIIGIAGGTGSGKSTFTNRLKKEFGEKVAVIYHDNYYREHHHLSFEERKKLNYDHPDAFETSLLIEHLMQLKNGEAVECPVYDFSQHDRTSETVLVEPKQVILVEGILVLFDKQLRQMLDVKIFVDADADERILRRILRDTQERGRDIQNIIDQYLDTVKPMHNLYVEPTRNLADIVVNSGMNQVAFQLVKEHIQMVLSHSGTEE
ncbi:MAG: uridine kinase [Massiliimalia sp.]|jgi:uridine kinase